MARSSAGESVLSRAVKILQAYDPGVRDLTASQIARKTGMPVTTTHRLVTELVSLGLLEKLPNAHYRIGLLLWELAVRTPGAVGIRELAHPFLRRALSEIGHHVQLAILQDGEIVSLERMSSPDAVVNITVVGGRMPYYATSSGLVLAAFASEETQQQLVQQPMQAYKYAPQLSDVQMRERLQSVRTTGFAITPGYIDPAATAIGVPVRGPAGNVIAALTAVVPTDNPQEKHVIDVLSTTARAISSALSARYLTP